MIKFICYPKCGTCQRARTFLDEKGIEYEVRDIKQDKPTLEEIKAWHEKSGLDIKRFFNTSGILYKEMGLKDALSAMSLEEKYSLLASDGMLVKRPIVVGDDFVLVGFKEKDWLF